MSKAFTRDDGPDEAPVIPPRAELPEGVPNYVTPRGLARLRAELAELEGERAQVLAVDGDAESKRPRLEVLTGRLADLLERIASAQLVEPPAAPPDVIRFGATVTVLVCSAAGEEERRFKIVGVDEADPSQGRIAFTAPIARALLGLSEGDSTTLRTGRGEETIDVEKVDYEF